MNGPGTVTGLLRAWGRGDEGARDALVPLVYRELHLRAAAYLRCERQNHTLQPTGLVHEAYVRLVRQNRITWQNRAQFFGVAARMMRRILIDYARSRRAEKRPGAGLHVTLDERLGARGPRSCELLALDSALSDLTIVDPRLGQIVELKFFGGLSEREIAEVLTVSRSTVTREWQTAKGWLHRRMTAPPNRGTR